MKDPWSFRLDVPAAAITGRLPVLSALGRRLGNKADRGGLGGLDLSFKFSTLLLVLSVFFVEDCLSSCEDTEAAGAVLAAEATLSLLGLPILPTSGTA